jgi:DNA polymerase III epsilon subunit-like protein
MILGILDCETTGLPLHTSASLNAQPHIIEWAVAHIDSKQGKITATYETLIKPPIAIPEVITKITGLTDEDLAAAPSFIEAYPIILESLSGIDVLIAHNAPFDTSMLRFELARHMIEDFVWPRVECTVQLYHDEYGRRMKLVELFEAKLGKQLAQTHRAMDDVNALAEIVIKEKLWKVLGAA